MSMNKKEQAAFDAALIDARRNRALSWSPLPIPTPTVMPPNGFEPTSVGWMFNEYSRAVVKAWSRASAHGCGEYPADPMHRSVSRDALRLYATKLDALRAMRAAMERSFADRLMEIDHRIEAEMGERQS